MLTQWVKREYFPRKETKLYFICFRTFFLNTVSDKLKAVVSSVQLISHINHGQNKQICSVVF